MVSRSTPPVLWSAAQWLNGSKMSPTTDRLLWLTWRARAPFFLNYEETHILKKWIAFFDNSSNVHAHLEECTSTNMAARGIRFELHHWTCFCFSNYQMATSDLSKFEDALSSLNNFTTKQPSPMSIQISALFAFCSIHWWGSSCRFVFFCSWRGAMSF